MAESVRVRILRDGQELEVEGDREFVREILDRFEQPAAPNQLVPPGDPPIDQEVSKTLSVREFVQRLGVKRHIDKVAAFGYYLEHHSGQTEFTSSDINNCYYEAKMDSSNTSQAIIQNIKRGYVMETKGGSKGKKKYMLTQSGEAFVSERLSGTS